jgi:hypothetical protein
MFELHITKQNALCQRQLTNLAPRNTDREPQLCHLHYDDFVEMAAAWGKLPNPALVAEDESAVVTPWHIVADKIRAMDIPSEVIDKALYTELVELTEPQVEVRLMKLTMTDELKQRQEDCSRRETANTFTYTVPQESNPGVMYAKRFSHQHPKGYVVETTPAHDDQLFLEVDMSQDEGESQEGKDGEKGEGQEAAARQKTTRRTKLVCQWSTALAVLISIAVAIALLWHFGKAGHD